MSAPPPAHPARTLNLRCARCSYELRGLDVTARCPECGTDIADTLEANRRRCGRLLLRARRMHAPPLARSDGRWLRAIAAGLVLLASVHLALVGWYVAWVPDESYHRLKTPDHQLFWIAAAHASAAWLLTGRQRGAGEQEHAKRRPLRRSLRLLALAPPLAAALGLVSELVPFQQHAAWATLARVPAVATPLVVYLTFDWIAGLAVRVRGRASVVAFHVTRLLATVFVAVMVAVGLYTGQRVAEIVASSLEALMALGGSGMLGLGLVTLLTLRLAWKLWAAAPLRTRATPAP